MRSIGKRNITKLKALVRDFVPALPTQRAREAFSQSATVHAIENAVPGSWRDIWESADYEITRIINDEVSAILYRRDEAK